MEEGGVGLADGRGRGRSSRLDCATTWGRGRGDGKEDPHSLPATPLPVPRRLSAPLQLLRLSPRDVAGGGSTPWGGGEDRRVQVSGRGREVVGSTWGALVLPVLAGASPTAGSS